MLLPYPPVQAKLPAVWNALHGPTAVSRPSMPPGTALQAHAPTTCGPPPATAASPAPALHPSMHAPRTHIDDALFHLRDPIFRAGEGQLQGRWGSGQGQVSKARCSRK